MEMSFVKNLNSSLDQLNRSIEIINGDLGFNLGELYDWADGRKRKIHSIEELSIDEWLQLSKKLNVSIDCLMRGEFCSQAVTSFVKGENPQFTQTQVGNGGSRVRTLKNTLDVLQGRERELVLRRLQITEDHLKHESQEIDITLIGEAAKAVQVLSYDYMIIEKIGGENALTLMNSVIGAELKKERKIKLMLQKFIEEFATAQDKNRNYIIEKENSDGFVVSSYPTQLTEQYFNNNKGYVELFHKSIKGFFEGSVIALGNDSASVVQINESPLSFQITFY